MTEPSTTSGTPALAFPKGVFMYTVGDASPLVDFDGHGGVPVTYNAEVIVKGSYEVAGDVFKIVDEPGPYAFPESGAGTYHWSLVGKTLSFALLEDNAVARKKGFAQPFVKQG